MNKRINFEDTLYVLNIRIRMIEYSLQLDIDTALFYQKTMEDLEFINYALESLKEKFLSNLSIHDIAAEADNILDAEYKFNRLLMKISHETSPFSAGFFPETSSWVSRFMKDSEQRKTCIEEKSFDSRSLDHEPVVSHAELNGLLGTLNEPLGRSFQSS